MSNRTTPKDFFVQLGATVALYIAAGALINLAFSIIDYLNPDALAGYSSAGSIAWPISMLVVLVPILYGLEWLAVRDASRMPEKRDIWIRKWRIYLTLFLVVALIGGDLIVLINTYLNGEITGRFIWKILAILIIAGAVGKYYFFSISERWKWGRAIRKGNAWFGIIMVVAAIGGGFLIVGSPGKQRAIRFDQERVSDLMNIQWRVISYWQAKSALPQALADLNDPIASFTVPTDPETGASYDYRIKGIMGTKGAPSGLAFDLCATFDLASQDASGRSAYGYGGSAPASYPALPGGTSDSWAHPAGQACFARMIDPQLYPSTAPKPL